MKLKQRLKCLGDQKRVGNERGVILVAALVLLSVLTLIGTTAYIVTSTDIQIGRNYRSSQQVLEVASAGAEHGRQKLLVDNTGSTNPDSFKDELAGVDGSNNALEGYTDPPSDDTPLVPSTTLGDYSYIVYLTNDAFDGVLNKANDVNNRVLITSVATSARGDYAKVEQEVTNGIVPIPSPVYAKGNITGNGANLTSDGRDHGSCSPPGDDTAPFYTKSPATTTLNGSPTLNGDPNTPQSGNLDIDIQSYIDSLNCCGITTLTGDQNNETFGDSSDFRSWHAQPSTSPPMNGEIKIQNSTGYGLLLIDGDLELGGNFNWNGLIIVSGTVRFNGGGNQINIKGAILANDTVAINGSIDIQYYSCYVLDSLPPVTVMSTASWKQVF